MKYIHTLVAGAVLLASVGTVTPVFASCAMQYPVIGRVSATSVAGNFTKITLDSLDYYDVSTFETDQTNIDAFNSLVAAYVQNNFHLPQNLKYKTTETTDYLEKNYNSVFVETAALNLISYQPGDIVVMGPPGGAACTMYGFVGFFSATGVLHAAVAYDNGYLPYTYGGDKLTLFSGTDESCTTNEQGTKTCTVPVTYALDNSAFILRPSQSNTSNSHFGRITLVQSTNTTLAPGNILDGYFAPRQLLQVFNFNSSSNSIPVPIPNPTPAPTPNQCPALARSLYRGLRGSDVSALQTFLISEKILASGNATGYFGVLTEAAVKQWQSKNGVDAIGIVGPKTRAAIATRCGM